MPKSNETEQKSPRINADDSEDESEVLEESPCGRWLKRREEVDQRDVPGIDVAYLAMDTEEGVEVVWNEVQFSERKKFKAQEEKISQVFDNLIQLEHPNIVKFHKYWMDRDSDKPRIIFITEYMPSGSLKQFLKKTKRNVKKLPLQAWKRWCTQILSALSYLHSCSPPVIHGNLTCDTIFIQHNGLIKIGSVAPDAIHNHVKTYRENVKNMHFVAPEYGLSYVTPAADIFSFGMCALEMGALEILGNGESGCIVTEEHVTKTIDLLEHPSQKDFIRRCLLKNPSDRPTARQLLFHPSIFEVHSLRLLAGHVLVRNKKYLPESWTDDSIGGYYGTDKIVAEVRHPEDGRPGVEMRMSDVPVLEKIEKFIEDVKNGIYPLTAFSPPTPPSPRPRIVVPETVESAKSTSPEPVDVEARKIVHMMCTVKPNEDSNGLWMSILLRMDDKMNRQLSCQVSDTDSSSHLADELVHFGFINENDKDPLRRLIEEALFKCFHANGNVQSHVLVGPSVANPISFGYPPPPMSVPIVSSHQGQQYSNMYMPPPFTEHGMA